MTPQVYRAEPAQEAALFDLLMAYKAENTYHDFSVDDDRVMEAIQSGTRGKGGVHGIIVAPDNPDRLAASIGIVWDRWWFSKDWGLAQIWLYVRPEYRKGTHYADALVEWAKTVRDDLEKKTGQRVRMANTVMSEERLDAKLRFWRRHSGEMIGAIFEIS